MWRLEGYDTFGGESYALAGAYASEAEAREAARRRLAELERLQPTASSGGQSGIQDRVYILAPSGERIRVTS